MFFLDVNSMHQGSVTGSDKQILRQIKKIKKFTGNRILEMRSERE